MKIKRFKYLKEKGMTDYVMFDIVKYTVIPSFNILFDDVVCHILIEVPWRKFERYPKWEWYLNVLIQKYNIPKNTVEEAVKRGICKVNEEVQRSLEKFKEKYRIIESKKK